MEAAKQSITIKELLESGAHFGHQRQRWNPKMKRFIYKEMNGIYIIDLSKTIQQVRNGIKVVEDAVAQHKSILFVGTKKQAKEVITECAEACEEFYVAERWLGGMLTNLATIRKSIKKLDVIEKQIESGGEGLTKKELSNLNKDYEKLSKNLNGVRAMRKQPGLVIVVDPNKEHIAVKEAKKLGVPVMALVDTNCDPDPIDHVIACNDDALKSIRLVLSSLSKAIASKKKEMNLGSEKKAAKAGSKEKDESAEEKEPKAKAPKKANAKKENDAEVKQES